MYRAARRYVQIPLFRRRLKSKLDDALTRIRGFEEAFTERRQPLDETATAKRLAECEYTAFEYLNYLYVADELIDSVTRSPRISPSDHVPLHEQLRVQMGLRHGICHNGLLGTNIVTVRRRGRVCYLFTKLQRRIDWEDSRAMTFERYFGKLGSTVLVVTRSLQKTIEPVVETLTRLRAEIETHYDRPEFRQYVERGPVRYQSPTTE